MALEAEVALRAEGDLNVCVGVGDASVRQELQVSFNVQRCTVWISIMSSLQ